MNIKDLASLIGALSNRSMDELAEILVQDHPGRAEYLESSISVAHKDAYYTEKSVDSDDQS